MKKLLVAALLAGVAVPAQATIQLIFTASLTDTTQIYDGELSPEEQEETVFGPYSDAFRLTGRE